MKASRKTVLFTYTAIILSLFMIQSCGDDEEPIFGEYQEIESGYKNCGPGAFSEQIEVLSERGICWRANTFSECFTAILTLSPDMTFMEISSGIKYFDDGTQEEGLQSETTGTFTFDADNIYLVKDTRFNREDTLSIQLDGSLHIINESLVNCELHGIYTKL